MKTSLSTSRVIAALATGAVVLSWAATAGAAGSTTKATTTKAVASNFCTTLASSSAKADSVLSGKITGLMNQFKTRDAKLVSNRAGADATIGQNRAKWTGEREGIYAKLLAKATTDAQKQAVAAFKSAMEAAVTARENAVDQARASFRTGLDQAIVKHTTAMNTAFGTYQTALKNAAAQAQAACASKQKPADVRNQYRAALKVARSDRQADIKSINKVGNDVKKLVETRNAAIQLALTNFHNAERAAVNALRAAFGEQPISTPAATTTPSTASTTKSN